MREVALALAESVRGSVEVPACLEAQEARSSCWYCGADIGRAGGDHLENLVRDGRPQISTATHITVPACGPCNSRKAGLGLGRFLLRLAPERQERVLYLHRYHQRFGRPLAYDRAKFEAIRGEIRAFLARLEAMTADLAGTLRPAPKDYVTPG